MQKYYFRTFISNSQIEILVSFSKSTNVNVNMFFPNSIFEWIFCTYVFGKSFYIIETWKVNVGHRDIFKKILNFFICVEVRILCKEVKYLWSSHFPEAITKTCRLEKTPLCLNTRLRVKKNFKIHNNFNEINSNVLLLCAHRVMKV